MQIPPNITPRFARMFRSIVLAFFLIGLVTAFVLAIIGSWKVATAFAVQTILFGFAYQYTRSTTHLLERWTAQRHGITLSPDG